MVSTDWKPVIEVVFSKQSKLQRDNQTLELEDLIGIKGIKAQGNQLSSFKIKSVNLLDPIPYILPEKNNVMDLEVNGEVDVKILKKDDQSSEEGQTEINFN